MLLLLFKSSEHLTIESHMQTCMTVSDQLALAWIGTSFRSFQDF